jgi:hypothetical protein
MAINYINAGVEQTHDKLFTSKAPQAVDNVMLVDPRNGSFTFSHTFTESFYI